MLVGTTPIRCRQAVERAGFLCVREDAEEWTMQSEDHRVTIRKTIRDLSDLELRTILVASGLTGRTFTKLLKEPHWKAPPPHPRQSRRLP